MLNLTWESLTTIAEEIKPESLFLLKNLIGNKEELFDGQEVKMQIKRGTYKMAALGNYGDPAIDVEKTYNIEEKVVTAPQVFLRASFGAKDIESMKPVYVNPINATAGDKNKELQMRVADTIAEMKDSIVRTIEYMIAQLLISGKIDYTNPFTNKKFTLDLEVPANQLNIAADWSNPATATPISDLKKWVRLFAKQVRIKPNILILGEAVAERLLESDEYKAETDKHPPLSNVKSIEWEINDDVEIIGQFVGIPTPVVYFGTYEDPKTGQESKYIPDDAVILTHTKFWKLGYGAIYDYDINPDGAIYKGKFFSKQKISDDGKNKYIYLETHPVPYINFVDALRHYKVTLE